MIFEINVKSYRYRKSVVLRCESNDQVENKVDEMLYDYWTAS